MKIRTTYIGVDIGKKGAIVGINDNLEVLFKYVMPLTKQKEIDLPELLKIFTDIATSYRACIVAVEDVHSIFGSSAKSNFQFGRSLGIIEGFVGAKEFSYLKVPPKTWQKIAHVGIPKSEDKKAMSLSAAKRLFPKVDFTATKRSTVPHDGIVDALLIAYYLKHK